MPQNHTRTQKKRREYADRANSVNKVNKQQSTGKIKEKNEKFAAVQTIANIFQTRVRFSGE